MEIVSYLRNIKDAYLGDGISIEQILFAEKQLDLHFADEYKKYLEEIGMISFSGRELTGLGRVERNDVVKVTIEQRKYNPLISGDLYVIENIDGIVIWQDAGGKVYQSETECKPQLIATSLVEYLTKD